MPAHSFAQAPRSGGPLAEVESTLSGRLPSGHSGFHLLDSNEHALRWRLALIDSAQHSLDLQYYVWWGDESGDLLLKRIVDEADRGVRVRLVLDDFSTMLVDETHLKLRDVPAAVIDSHPNIQVRLFNPWHNRAITGRILESFERPERINHRMHNKLLIADNRATIIGGRNVGNEYFGLSSKFNFRDLDSLGVGPVARQASAVFDRFWNSSWVLEKCSASGFLRASCSDIRTDCLKNSPMRRFSHGFRPCHKIGETDWPCCRHGCTSARVASIRTPRTTKF
jgi:putative cardiolipin synthase